ncbi:DUF2264 domain-containing protein [Oribacterium sp. P6A1]|uniref:DUF2264 domain-containing protein n=1 Tax=Oribacterium sp. P6A1 TaxID=1410612 RepID=UPI000565031C|nr:DUF2264 domain-containing protein [Oribacterium sp. P6A1]
MKLFKDLTPSDLSDKQKAQKVLLQLLKSLIPFYSESGARLRIGDTGTHYELSSQEMEAFARPLWGLVPLLAGLSEEEKSTVLTKVNKTAIMENKTLKDGFCSDSYTACTSSKDSEHIPSLLALISELVRIYIRGIEAGTDPESPDYWGLCHDFDQKFCEMPAIGFALLYAPEFFFDTLSDRVKENLSDWLNECNRHNLCACNWQFFQIITNLALKVRGLPYSKENMENGLRMIDEYYGKGGWYNDGNGGDKDYYNPFVMLSFGLIYREFMKEVDPEHSERFLERAMAFGKDFEYFFDDSGACFPYGRSMTYRFAQSAFWSTCLMTEVYPIPKTRILQLLCRNLSWWLNRPIFDNAGILTIGYGYPNLQMSESYNAPGSPYWALQAFFYLALKDDDEIWDFTNTDISLSGSVTSSTCETETLFLPHVPMLLQRGYKDGHCTQVVALVPGKTNHEGHSHNVEKYSKFAYSSKFGFSIARSNMNLQENAPDSTLAFVIDGFVYTKNMTEEDYIIDKDHVEMHWSPVRGIDVITVLRPTERGHIREHMVKVSGKLYKDVEIKAYDCGFAVPENEDACTVHSLGCEGRVELLIPEPNTNLIYPKTRIPMCVYDINSGDNYLKTEFIYL